VEDYLEQRTLAGFIGTVASKVSLLVRAPIQLFDLFVYDFDPPSSGV
jgi:hypothetical protein